MTADIAITITITILLLLRLLLPLRLQNNETVDGWFTLAVGDHVDVDSSPGSGEILK